MTIDKKGNIKLDCSGRIIKMHGTGHIGIFETAQGFDLGQGYDSYLPIDSEDHPFEQHATSEEKRELAQYMVNMWKKFGGIE
jgi:hypothetical protein